MRIIHDKHRHGDTRERTFFAWLPVTFHGGTEPRRKWRPRETRWLETVRIRETYLSDSSGSHWCVEEFLPVEAFRGPVEALRYLQSTEKKKGVSGD